MSIFLIILLIIPLYLLAFLSWRLYFLRNPKRTPPPGNLILSPADGVIIYQKRIENGQIPISTKNGETISWDHVIGLKNNPTPLSGYLIGIAMTPFSVHRNRIPITGKITNIYYQPAKKNNTLLLLMAKLMLKIPFDSKDTENMLYNEKLTLEINTQKSNYYVTQIAGNTIDRIVVWNKEGDTLKSGEEYGMIRFGSQCDLFLPDQLIDQLNLSIGGYVYAGVSSLGTFQE